jgi:hypothetical protein
MADVYEDYTASSDEESDITCEVARKHTMEDIGPEIPSQLSLLKSPKASNTKLGQLECKKQEKNRYFGLCDMKKSLFRPNLKISKYF